MQDATFGRQSMPLFAYICNACEARTELLVRGNEEVVCPACGSSEMERQLSHFAPVSGAGAEPACSGCAMASEGCRPAHTCCPGCTH